MDKADLTRILDEHAWNPADGTCRCYAWHPYGNILETFSDWRDHILNLPDMAQ